MKSALIAAYFALPAALFALALYLIGSAPAQPAFDWALHMTQAQHDAIIATLNHSFLVAAYAVTWAVQLAYVGWLYVKWQTGNAASNG